MGRVILDRQTSFSSGHRYWDPALSDAENRALYGRWASQFNHGHNYVLRAAVAGEVDYKTGMVVNIKDIDAILIERIRVRFDQKSINDEVPELAGKTPCLENLLAHFADVLTELPAGAELTSLKLEETPLLYGEWHKETDMTTLTRIYEFAASHRLHSDALSAAENEELFSKCWNPEGHGHNYLLEVTVSGRPDERTGMITSIDDLDKRVHELVVDRYDHKNLNRDVPELVGKVPTSEVVSEEIFAQLDGNLPAQLERVRLHETARSSFEVVR
jgi:6-pyruvoyltetrahydropterin/6-carboxytetrahydropterin synthase